MTKIGLGFNSFTSINDVVLNIYPHAFQYISTKLRSSAIMDYPLKARQENGKIAKDFLVEGAVAFLPVGISPSPETEARKPAGRA
jgi:hypothetical protein